MTTATQFTGDLLEYAQDYAETTIETTIHVVSHGECTTEPFRVFDELDASDFETLTTMMSDLMRYSEVDWAAVQIGVWLDLTGKIAALLTAEQPNPLATESLALVVIDAEGQDFWVRQDGEWHMLEDAPRCDASGVCS